MFLNVSFKKTGEDLFCPGPTFYMSRHLLRIIWICKVQSRECGLHGDFLDSTWTGSIKRQFPDSELYFHESFLLKILSENAFGATFHTLLFCHLLFAIPFLLTSLREVDLSPTWGLNRMHCPRIKKPLCFQPTGPLTILISTFQWKILTTFQVLLKI